MSEVQQVRRPLRRGRFWVGVGLLLFAGAATAVAGWWFLGRPPAPPTPPEAKGGQLDPAIAEAVRAARERVLKEPRSAQAWGDLGEVFLANELEDESRPCFAEAERLDPRNPRWPYFQAGPLLNRGDLESALPLLRRAAELCPADDDDAAAAIRLRLAEALLVLGRQDEAETQIEFALGRQPNDPRALFDRAPPPRVPRKLGGGARRPAPLPRQPVHPAESARPAGGDLPTPGRRGPGGSVPRPGRPPAARRRAGSTRSSRNTCTGPC